MLPCCSVHLTLATNDDVVYCRGEIVSVPKSGDLPRPSVASVIGGPEPAVIGSECRPISSKEVVQVNEHEGARVGESSPHYKSGIVEMDIEETEGRHVEEQEGREAAIVEASASDVSRIISMKNLFEFPKMVQVACVEWILLYSHPGRSGIPTTTDNTIYGTITT